MADVRGGNYYSPNFFYFRAYPTKINPPSQARNKATDERLWHVSEERTG